MEHNWVKIAYWAKKIIYLEISQKWFLSTYCALPCCKVWKSPLRGSCDKKLHNFEPQFDKNCSFGLKEDFFEKRYSSNLSLLIMPYQATKFGKNPYSRYCDISLYNFRPQSNQNCPFHPIENFLEIALKWFLCNYCPLLFLSLKLIWSWEILWSRKKLITICLLIFKKILRINLDIPSTQSRPLRTDIYILRLGPKWPTCPNNNFYRTTKYNIHIILVHLLSTILKAS